MDVVVKNIFCSVWYNPKDKKKPKEGFIIPDRKEHPPVFSGDAGGWQVHGLENAGRCDS